MACIYLMDGMRQICKTKGEYLLPPEKITKFCETDEFKNCITYKEMMRTQNAPRNIKFLTNSFSISILVTLALLLMFGITTINDWKVQFLIAIASIIIGVGEYYLK